MAIHTMSDADHAHYSMPYYWGHERGLIRHAKGCPHFAACQVCCSDDSFRQEIRTAGLHADCIQEGTYSERCSGPFEALYMQISYEGCVLETRERNLYDDSDFYALVWDETEQRVKSVEYATTRGWTYPNHADVDATPEVRAKAEAYYKRQAEIAYAASLERPSVQFLETYASHNGRHAVCELKEECKTRAAISEPCRKCNGLGYWQNPNRAHDRRPCFGCSGTGSRKVAAPKGTAMTRHAKGKRGRFVRAFINRSRYGTWVNSERVELQTESGELFTVDLGKVRIIEAAE